MLDLRRREFITLLGGVTITRGDLTSPGPLQKGVYSKNDR